MSLLDEVGKIPSLDKLKTQEQPKVSAADKLLAELDSEIDEVREEATEKLMQMADVLKTLKESQMLSEGQAKLYERLEQMQGAQAA